MSTKGASQRKASQARVSPRQSDGTISNGFVATATQEPSEVLRAILDDPTVTTAEKINAAKALDQIQKRGADRHGGRASRMTRAEIQGEIDKVRAILSAKAG